MNGNCFVISSKLLQFHRDDSFVCFLLISSSKMYNIVIENVCQMRLQYDLFYWNKLLSTAPKVAMITASDSETGSIMLAEPRDTKSQLNILI